LLTSKYKAFIESKTATENKLLSDVRDQMKHISSKLETFRMARGWERSFDGYDAREDGVEYFVQKLNDCLL
jgi:hypothetical protein